ncbi:FAD-dependent oxidoreductase [Nocardia sp. NEAU-G5]|uniref:FAD-dependent oxidoreductase n=1 Tax=Nocardia albiluteola TaxID=2842303 RepID=A0ABS6AX96_9NOCA|nr:FAD-dependent oxidoreductase [Nocardia albiluteola]MBU3062691.1 FAD-dependent oxidoreductase [Nocardia albiluteola]MBU3065475.1 FAD-dependent oxidoreductase [Nocardia albiluteola]
MDRTTCLVAGGGPAGIVLGLLLARAGVEVTVLEKHGDFLRDFRGDTVHPTTLDLLDELGLGERFAKIPHRRLTSVQLPLRGGMFTAATFDRLPGPHRYIAMVPQWDLLNLLASEADSEPAFQLRMNTEAVDVIRENGRVVGARYRTRDGETGEIRADLTVACDGRSSALRAAAGLGSRRWATPFDVWWFRIPRHDSDPAGALGFLTPHRVALMFDRGDYWQCATLIVKGSDPALREGPITGIMRPITEIVPWLSDRLHALSSWDEVKLLDVQLDRLDRWYADGLLCLGDAAHAMSPVGGVGINLAVQDAVAAARILAPHLLSHSVTTADLARVQRRRLLPTVITQGLQRLLHARAIAPALQGDLNISDATRAPLPLRLLRRIPMLRDALPYLVARGVLPEHAPEFARRPG